MPSKLLHIGKVKLAAFSSLAAARKVLLSGEAATSLAAYLAARTVREKKTIRFICGDNRFDTYRVARYAKQMGMRPEDALRSILIARAFTAYQMTELVDRLDCARAGELVVISGPCSTFFDEDLSIVDAARLFYRMLWRITGLARSGMSLLLVQGQIPQNTRRSYFMKDLCRSCDVVLRLAGQYSFTLEHRRRVRLPQLAAIDQRLCD